jgi:aspartate carbamoyltransferase catalytic subunit
MHSRVALSNIYALKMQGAEVKVCGPKHLPRYIESLGVTVEPNLIKALEWCDVVCYACKRKNGCEFFLLHENMHSNMV